jgi:hypothetical protein
MAKEDTPLRSQRDMIHRRDGPDKDIARRWVMFFALSSLNLLSGFGWTMYDAIANYSESYYSVENGTVL